jgi:hypothetical protein
MPYPFAHPAAALALAPLMGRLAVPSALVIGTIAPDLWYALPFVPTASHHLSHSLAGVLLFCLPVSVAAYLLFHLLFKDACLSLLPPALGARLRHFTVKGLPAAPLYAVLGSLVLGTLSHLAWDSLTKSHAAGPVNWLQHASTLLGTLVLGWWLWRKLRSAPLATLEDSGLSPTTRAWVWALLLAIAAASAGWSAHEWQPTGLNLTSLRHVARIAGAAAMQGFAVAGLLCCAAWKLR